MATVHIRMGGVMPGGVPAYTTKPDQAQTLTSSGTSQATTITAQGGEYASVTASGGAVFILIDPSPTAASGVGDLVPDGATKDYGPLKANDKVAIIDA